MSDAALNIFNKDGKMIFSSEWGHARILGTIKPTLPDGSYIITTADGTPLNTLFAWLCPRPGHGSAEAGHFENIVEVVGNTVKWTRLNLSKNPSIIYGDSYV